MTQDKGGQKVLVNTDYEPLGSIKPGSLLSR
jgi:hypothetical protein